MSRPRPPESAYKDFIRRTASARPGPGLLADKGEALQSTLKAAIEKGQPLPPEVVEAITKDVRTPPSAARDLRAGVIWLGVAAGLVGMGYALGYNEDSAEAFWPMLGIACFPGFIGLAVLVMAAINRNKGYA